MNIVITYVTTGVYRRYIYKSNVPVDCKKNTTNAKK